MRFFWTKTLKDKPKKKLSTLRSSRQCPWPQVTPTATFHLFGATKKHTLRSISPNAWSLERCAVCKNPGSVRCWTPGYGEISGDETCHRFPRAFGNPSRPTIPACSSWSWGRVGRFSSRRSASCYAVYSNMEKRWPSQTLRWLSTVVAPHRSLKTRRS